MFETPPPAEHTLQAFSRVPHPYVVEPPAWGARAYAAGETLVFGMVLIGRARTQLPLIVLAWQRAFARGVGAGDGTARLRQVTREDASGDATVFDAQSGILEDGRTDLPLSAAAPTAVTLRIETPLRLQHNGHALGRDRLTPRELLTALVRRAGLLAEFHGGGVPTWDFGGLAAAARTVEGTARLRWRDWTRYSSRQDRKHALGGVVGEWRLEGELAPFWPFLELGAWLHVGKGATFGLGRYRLGA